MDFRETMLVKRFFNLASGYVMDLSNAEFRELIASAVNIDIDDAKYKENGESKGKRLQSFFTLENDRQVGITLEKLLDYWLDAAQNGRISYDVSDERNYEECRNLSVKLQGGQIDVSDLVPNVEDEDFTTLSMEIKRSIDDNNPQVGLDRLHTFCVRYFRALLEKHEVENQDSYPLHSLVGNYLKHVQTLNIVESEMTIRLLKMSISAFESFNDVRNNQSLAHPNKLLNKEESLFVFQNVASTIRFVKSLEAKIDYAKN